MTAVDVMLTGTVILTVTMLWSPWLWRGAYRVVDAVRRWGL